MGIKENILSLKSSIPENVCLVAVSKTKPVSQLIEAYEAGQKDFGENYVQEFIEKVPAMPEDVRWHFIGHLQRNKVKQILPFVYLIHGVDSERLLDEINKQAAKINKVIPCLLQAYVASEETKFGMDINELNQCIDKVKQGLYPSIELKGLMGMASNTDNQTQVQKEFRNLYELYKECKERLGKESFTEVSMGMSGDYQLAIKEGSTMVRIGSSIFGARNYPA